MNVTCEHARTLLPGYLDGELSEAHAGPLRAHLMDCVSCRESVKEGKALQRWFTEAELPSVSLPDGFAARVARRAAAGDPGLSTYEIAPPARGAGATARPLLPFLLTASAVAAAILFLFALAIQNTTLPSGTDARADDVPPWVMVEDFPEEPALPRPPIEEVEEPEAATDD